jgi:hypothetical protein
MANPCTAFLIDPAAKTVEPVQWNGDYQQIAKLIDADFFDAARFNRKGDTVYVDDEGLIKEGPAYHFIITGYPQPLAGKGLILGTDNNGESVAPSITLEDAKLLVRFGGVARIADADGSQQRIVWIEELGDC